MTCCFPEKSFFFAADCVNKTKNKDIDNLWVGNPNCVTYATSASGTNCEDVRVFNIAGVESATPLIYIESLCKYPDFVWEGNLDIETCEVEYTTTFADLQIPDNGSIDCYCAICEMFCADVFVVMHRKGETGDTQYLIHGMDSGNKVTNIKYDSSVGCFQIGISGESKKPQLLVPIGGVGDEGVAALNLLNSLTAA